MSRTYASVLGFAFALCFICAPLFAGEGSRVGSGRMNFEFDFGKFSPDTDSSIYQDLQDTTTFHSDDFDGSTAQFKLLYQTSKHLQLGFGYSHFEQDQTVVDRDFVDGNGAEIAANIELKSNWVGFNGAWAPFGWGTGELGGSDWHSRLFVPYLAFGGGLKSWDFGVKGAVVEIVDGSPEIYSVQASADNISFVGKIGCGVRVNLHEKIDFNFLWEKEIGEDDLGSDFEDEDLDLGGKAIYIGVVVRL